MTSAPGLFWLPMRRYLQFLTIVLMGLAVAGCRQKQPNEAITLITDPGAKAFAVTERLVREFEAQTGQRVRVINSPADATDRLSQYLQYLGGKSPDIDVYEIDVVWPASLQNHLVDLRPAVTTETQAFLPQLIANDTVGSRLVALPYYLDLPLLYYRQDLLRKHGFKKPPRTWDELTTTAAVIQDAERNQGDGELWGYVWQGRAYEGLTCNALEWQVSDGGGQIVGEDGAVEVDSPGAVGAMERAAGWVGTISPPGVTMYAEEEARQLFQTGHCVFMRNWPYAFSLVNGAESPVAGKVSTAPLPAGSSGRTASTLGGGQLAVSKYSKHREGAIALVKFLTSARAQKLQALESSRLPTRTALYGDPEIGAAFPFMAAMRESLDSAVARPSNATGIDYNEVSTYYFQHVHQVLTKEKSAAESMRSLQDLLQKVLAK